MLETIATTHDTNIVLDETAVQAFKTRLRGELLRPGDAAYEQARRVWNGMIDRRPALIARCQGVADVIAAVNFARTNHLPVAVRGGGHNVAGSATCDDGLVIDLSRMKGIQVDPKARTARAEPGVNWGELDRATQVFGLVTPGGEVSITGIAGLTLGGGYGWTRRKYGLSCDNLVSVDIVTADGQFLTASETENAELFWGLRGGGGNFGIVTSFEYRLHELGPEVMAAMVFYPLEQAGELLRAWRAFAAQVPDEVTLNCEIWGIPADPELPEELHGRPVIIFDGMYAGPVDEGVRALQPLREFATPLLDLSGPASYTAVQSAFDAFVPDGLLYYWKSIYLESLSDAAIDAIAARALARPSPRTLLVTRQLGGAISRVAEDATAIGNRSAPYMLSIDATWEDPQDTERHIAWTRDFWSEMQAYSNGGVYLNFPGLVEEGKDLVRAGHGANYERLVALKNRYDPDNLFRFNQNIKPTV